MKILPFTDIHGRKISIVAEKITGFIDCSEYPGMSGNTFVSTGADGPDASENGWYVAEEFDAVAKLVAAI